MIEQDLRHAIDGGLDKLVLDAIATARFQAPGDGQHPGLDPQGDHDDPGQRLRADTLLLTPTAAESIDTMVSGITGGSADFVFAPGQFAPGTLFGLQRRVSKTIPAPAVVDAAALGKMYMSPVSLERFEADAGTTNRANVRLELHACLRRRADGSGRPDRGVVMAKKKDTPRREAKKAKKAAGKPKPASSAVSLRQRTRSGARRGRGRR